MVLPSLTPSLSLWWYFFIEMFDHFRSFYLLVFNAHLFLWTAPICIRFRHDPFVAFVLLLGVQALFKPYPTLGDVGLWLTFTLCLVEFSSCEFAAKALDPARTPPDTDPFTPPLPNSFPSNGIPLSLHPHPSILHPSPSPAYKTSAPH